MRANVDEKAKSDPRFRILARALCIRVDYAIGAVTCGPWLTALNRVSEDNPSGLLTRLEADNCSEDGPGLIEAMLDAGLARLEDDGRIYFVGLEERGAFLLAQRRRGASGGKAKAKLDRSARRANAKQTLSDGLANAMPAPQRDHSQISGSGSGSGSGSKNKGADEPLPFALEAPKPKPTKAPPVEGFQACVDDFHRRYVQRTGGQKPSWGPAQLRMMRDLVADHGAATVQKHTAVLFTAPPAFLAGSTPDMATLRQHFDKLAEPYRAPARAGAAAPTPPAPVQPYRAPVVADAVDPAEVAALAANVLKKMRSYSNE